MRGLWLPETREMRGLTSCPQHGGLQYSAARSWFEIVFYLFHSHQSERSQQCLATMNIHWSVGELHSCCHPRRVLLCDWKGLTRFFRYTIFCIQDMKIYTRGLNCSKKVFGLCLTKRMTKLLSIKRKMQIFGLTFIL